MASWDFVVIADAIAIVVCFTVTATDAQSVKDVSVAVAVSFRDVSTSALVDLTWAVAYAARVEGTDAVVYVVTDAIGVGVRCAVTTTFTKRVELISVAVAVSFRDVRTSALIDLTWTVAHAARVEGTDAVVYVITDAIGVGIRCAVTTTFTKRVKLVSIAVAVSFRDVSTSALVDLCLLYTSPSPRDRTRSRMPSSA